MTFNYLLSYLKDTRMTLSELIAELSTGAYYNSIEEWFLKLTKVLSTYDIGPNPLPTIHTDNGNGFILTNSSNKIYFTWYKMPETGHWEIICYLVKGN